MDRPESCTLDVSCIDMRLAGLSQAIMHTTDPYTARHQDRVAVIASAIGKEMGLPPLRRGRPRSRQGGHPERDFEQTRQAFAPGSSVDPDPRRARRPHLERCRLLCTRVLDVISMHHEYIDGSGYPSGLAGDAIPIEARILTVADIYEAMTAHRTYRPSLGSETALAELRSGSGSRFDPQVIAALEAILARIGNLESLDALGE